MIIVFTCIDLLWKYYSRGKGYNPPPPLYIINMIGKNINYIIKLLKKKKKKSNLHHWVVGISTKSVVYFS
jgi:hypothetical protein